MIDCYNKKISIPSPILSLMEDIWKISQDLIYFFLCFYREANRIVDCLAKKGLRIIDSNLWWSPKMLQILVLMIIVNHFPIMFARFLFSILLS